MYFSSHLDHPNIVKFKVAYLIPAGTSILKDVSVPEIWMAMEFLQGGTLNEASKIVKLSEKHVAFVAREVLKALKYIHEQGYAHRYVLPLSSISLLFLLFSDLKSQNVMLSIEGQVKLIDMGLMCDFRKVNLASFFPTNITFYHFNLTISRDLELECSALLIGFHRK